MWREDCGCESPLPRLDRSASPQLRPDAISRTFVGGSPRRARRVDVQSMEPGGRQSREDGDCGQPLTQLRETNELEHHANVESRGSRNQASPLRSVLKRLYK